MVMLWQPTPPPPGVASMVAGPQFGRIVAESILGHPALNVPERRRGFGRIVKRIARYVGLAALMYLGGWAGGLYLPIGWTGVTATGLAVAGGARAAVLAGEDLSRIAFFRESAFLRTVIAGKVGGLFGILPFVGALHGTIAWTIRASRRSVRGTVESGTGINPFGLFGHGGLSGSGYGGGI